MPCPVAVVGMACRYPDAPHPAALWRNILARRTSFRPYGKVRWDHRLFTQTTGRDSLSTRTERTAFVDDIEFFAARHFGISPRRAQAMDPQHRLSLEVAREALQDAGLEARPFDRQRSAVYLGGTLMEYDHLVTFGIRARQAAAGEFGTPQSLGGLADRVRPVHIYTVSGLFLSMAASVISQVFDLQGPAMALDGACASSLLAVTQAVAWLRSLPPRRQASPLALAGGFYLQLLPDNVIGFSRIGAVARRECRPFDAAAEGFLLGEGVGMVVLKRLADALADGDRIYAVLKGVAASSDGRAESPMTPRLEGQVQVIQMALEDAGVDPASIDYCEGHGTATRVGDAVELGALVRGLGRRGSPRRLGSVKANFGHTLSAAGVAGLMRAALALHHGVLPPQASWERWHPDLEQYASDFVVETEPRPWEAPLRRATVGSFGFGGCNSFCVLEQAPPAQTPAPGRNGAGRAGQEPLWYCLSAPGPELLAAYLRDLRPHLGSGPAAYTASAARGLGAWAAVFRAAGPRVGEVLGRLERALEAPPSEWTEVEGAWLGPLPPEPPAGLPPELWEQGPGRAEAVGRLYPPEARRLVELPFVPLERQKYWPILDPPPAPPLPQEVEFTLSLEEHPYLEDHRLGGRPVVPLALALDRLSWGRGLEPPFALARVRVEGGLSLSGPARVRVVSQGDQVRLVEEGGRVAFSARVLERLPLPPEVRLGSVDELPLELSLEEFYRSRTFHGPRLQGVERVLRLWPRGVEGLVRTSSPSGLSPGDSRPEWHVDPLAVDAAFQLAIYWTQCRRGQGLLPLSIEEMAVLEPFGPDRVEARIELEDEAGHHLTGCIRFFARGRLVGWMGGVRGRVVRYESLLAQR
jgi:3-oxoacyl-(acyl-carrier-protein) synthase